LIARRGGKLFTGIEVLRSQEGIKDFCEFIKVAGLALPDDQHLPAKGSEFSQIGFITRYIRLPFGSPELRTRFRHHSAVSTTVHMPEAAVNKDYLPVTDKNQIRLPRQITPV